MKNKKLKLVLVLLAFAFLFSLSGCKKSYELNFDTNGGVTIESVSVNKESEVELPIPTKDGYEFVGWYTSSDFSGEAVTKLTLTENLTVYAKWEELYKVTLDLDGGSLDKTFVYGKAGQSILSLLEGIKPTKAGLTFGAWYINGAELNANTKLTNKGATVVAKYKANYVINVYKQNITLDGYEKEEIKDSAFVDKKVSGSQVFEGFTEVTKEDSVDEIVVSNDASKNVMNVYYDRDQYTVTFRSNYPDESMEAKSESFNVVYGEDFNLPEVDFSLDGYYLAGWSTSKDGEVIYDANFLNKMAVNEEKEETGDIKVEVNRNMSLYAIWVKGYDDMFGGSDVIFKVSDEKVYLCRGGVYFAGEFFEDDNSFIFYNSHENIEGKVFDDNTFAFYNVSRDEFSATLYEVGKGLNNDVKVLFDAYNGITYSVKDGRSTSESKGSYTIDENGYYIATFTEGELAGQTLTMLFGTVTLDNEKTSAFQLRNEDEYNLGQLVRFAIYNNNITYYTSAYDVLLSGFGVMRYNTGTGYTSYYYTYDASNKTLVFSNQNGQTMATAKVMEVNGKMGYMIYDASSDVTYTNEDGDTLVMNGMGSIAYNFAGGKLEGYYAITSSAFGGKIVKFTANGTNYVFLCTTKTEEVNVGEDGTEKQTVTTYSFVRKSENYAEYYYKGNDGIYYAPLIVLNDNLEGVASVYAYTKNKTFELALVGEYALDEDGKVYVFNLTDSFELSEDVINSPYDISTIKGFKFTLDTTSTEYAIHYYNELTIGEETFTYGTSYTSTDGSTLYVIAGIAILNKEGMVISGQIKNDLNTNLATITNPNGTIYVMIDVENKTFKNLEYAPYNAYVVSENGTYNRNQYVTFDGLGNATYFYPEEEVVDGENKTVQKSITGVITKTEDSTKEGLVIYEFKSEELNIKYVTYQTSSGTFVFPYNDKYNGQYTSSKDGVLYLDGFGYAASFTDTDGVEYKGIYSIVDENVVRLNDSVRYRYFDLSGKNFTARGLEYGTYILMDNQGMPGLYLELNGYGDLVVYKYDRDTNDELVRTDVDTNAKYVIVDGKFTLTYTDNNKETLLIGYTGTYTYNNNIYNVFRIEHEEVVSTFLNEKDWTVLKLDSIGNAKLYGSDGIVTEGTYMLITDSLLYFVNASSTDANIFTYNYELGTIVESEFTARGYYTADLKSLLFSEYGFAIFNNETRYYYTMEGDNVIIYHQDAENANANEYGFVKDVFGEFSEVKEYNGETYYANDGYAIIFRRSEETKNDYPVKVTEENIKPLEELVFTPSGSDTFNVSGSVKVDGTNYKCNVIRELVDGEYVMYITIGYFRFDITAKYTGKDVDGNSSSTYEVTNMSYIRSFYPYTYLDTYYLLYSFLGPNYAASYTNNLGMFYLCTSFDKEGNETENYLKVDFFEGSKVYDLNEKLLSQEKASYALNEKSGIYTVDLEASDGYTYRLYFAIKLHRSFNLYGYQIYAVTRIETLKDNDYTLTVERVIASEQGYDVGYALNTRLYVGETELDGEGILTYNGAKNVIVRTKDEETGITTTKYYRLVFTDKNAGSIEDGEDSVILAPYEKVVITELDVTTIYTMDGSSYIDVLDGKVVLVRINGNAYSVSESNYDEETNTYSITLSNGKNYTVSFDEDGNALIELAVAKEESGE